MKAHIKKHDPQREFYIDEGCFINELSNGVDDNEVSIAQARVEAGVTTEWHRLVDTTERYCIIAGEGQVEVDDLPVQQVGPGDVVLIPPMSRQRIRNSGSTDLVFLAICTPRFSMDVYQALQD